MGRKRQRQDLFPFLPGPLRAGVCVAIDTLLALGSLGLACLHLAGQAVHMFFFFFLNQEQLCLPSTYNEYLQLQAPTEILKPPLVTVICLGSVSNYMVLSAHSRLPSCIHCMNCRKPGSLCGDSGVLQIAV